MFELNSLTTERRKERKEERERVAKSERKEEGGLGRLSERKDNKNKFNVVTSSFSIHALYKFLVSDAVHATIGCKATHAG